MPDESGPFHVGKRSDGEDGEEGKARQGRPIARRPRAIRDTRRGGNSGQPQLNLDTRSSTGGSGRPHSFTFTPGGSRVVEPGVDLGFTAGLWPEQEQNPEAHSQHDYALPPKTLAGDDPYLPIKQRTSRGPADFEALALQREARPHRLDPASSHRRSNRGESRRREAELVGGSSQVDRNARLTFDDPYFNHMPADLSRAAQHGPRTGTPTHSRSSSADSNHLYQPSPVRIPTRPQSASRPVSGCGPMFPDPSDDEVPRPILLSRREEELQLEHQAAERQAARARRRRELDERARSQENTQIPADGPSRLEKIFRRPGGRRRRS